MVEQAPTRDRAYVRVVDLRQITGETRGSVLRSLRQGNACLRRQSASQAGVHPFVEGRDVSADPVGRVRPYARERAGSDAVDRGLHLAVEDVRRYKRSRKWSLGSDDETEEAGAGDAGHAEARDREIPGGGDWCRRLLLRRRGSRLQRWV